VLGCQRYWWIRFTIFTDKSRLELTTWLEFYWCRTPQTADWASKQVRANDQLIPSTCIYNITIRSKCVIFTEFVFKFLPGNSESTFFQPSFNDSNATDEVWRCRTKFSFQTCFDDDRRADDRTERIGGHATVHTLVHVGPIEIRSERRQNQTSIRQDVPAKVSAIHETHWRFP